MMNSVLRDGARIAHRWCAEHFSAEEQAYASPHPR